MKFLLSFLLLVAIAASVFCYSLYQWSTEINQRLKDRQTELQTEISVVQGQSNENWNQYIKCKDGR